MTTGLVLYPDGEIREVDLDPGRPDVLAVALNAEGEALRVDLSPRLVLFVDRWATRDAAPVNVYASLMELSAAHHAHEPTHGINGPALLFGRTVDGEIVDVGDGVLELLRTLSEVELP